MSFVVYKDLKTPNEVLEKMTVYIKSKGYSVVEDLKDDYDIYDGTVTIVTGKQIGRAHV